MAKKIGPYEIVSELGRGGMGVVYKAREESLQRYVAIKMLGNQLLEDEAVSERFMREARVVADLNHPNLVQVFRVDRHEEQPYFVMEYVEGDSLKALIQRERQMQPVRALQILQEAANGLAAAHDKGVVHRDIKPENIMLTKYGGVKVVDFGIARDENAETRLTTTGIGMGTPSYLSPEVCLSQEVDQRSDIFSMGVVLFEMLTGDIPFKSDSPFEMMTKVVEAKIPDIKELNPNVDEGIKKILAKMIAKRPKLRYQHCNELISDIEDYRAGREPRWAKTVVLDDAVETTGPTAPRAAAGSDTPTAAATVAATTPMPVRKSNGSDSPPTVRTAPPTATTQAFDANGGSRKGLAVAALFLVLVLGGAAASTWYLLAGSDKPLLAWFGGSENGPEAVIESEPRSLESRSGIAAAGSGSTADSSIDSSSDSSGDRSTAPSQATTTASPGPDRRLAMNSTRGNAAADSDEDPSADVGDGSSADAGEGAGFRFAVEAASEDSSTPVSSRLANESASGSSSDSSSGSPYESSDAYGAGESASAERAVASTAVPTTSSTGRAGSNDADLVAEASEQPPAEFDTPSLDTDQAVARVTSPARNERAPAWNPAAPRIVVMAAGDPAVASAIEDELEQALNRASFDLLDEQLMDGMSYAESLPDIVRAAADEGADILVFADVVPAGERELNFYGRTDYQYLANLQVRVVVLHERRNLGPMLRERLEYVGLNADDKAREASRAVVRDVITRLRALRAGAASAAG